MVEEIHSNNLELELVCKNSSSIRFLLNNLFSVNPLQENPIVVFYGILQQNWGLVIPYMQSFGQLFGVCRVIRIKGLPLGIEKLIPLSYSL